jgi:signal transduction histidine kinase
MRGLRRLSREAQADVKRLLKRTRKGTLTGKQLQAGLTEVASDLGAVLGFHYFRI